MPFDQSDDIAVLRSAEQVAFPVTRHGPVLYGSGSFPYGNRIRDLAALLRCMPRATDRSPGPQMLQELLFQHAAGLHIKATIDGLVHTWQTSVPGCIRFSQPAICSGDQLRSS